MKGSLLEKIFLIILAAIFGGIVIHTPLSVGFGVLFPEFALFIKSWKEILMVVAVLVAIAIIIRRQAWPLFIRDRLLALILIFALLHSVLLFVFNQGILPSFAGLAIDLRYMLFFVLVYVAVRLMPEYRRLFVNVAIVGAYIVVGFATLQLFLPPDILHYIGYSKETIMPYLTVDRNPEYIRVNSTLRGPNPLGAYAGIVLALLAAAAVKTRRWQSDRRYLIGGVVLAVFGTIALWISYSRSALVGGIVAVGVVFAVTLLRKLSRRAWIVSLAVLFALVGAGIAGRDTPFISNVLLHENPSGGSEVSSNEEHVASLGEGFARLLEQPFGAGVGSTGSASLQGPAPIIIENQYLFIAHEAGWAGLLLFLAIFCIVMSRLWHCRGDWLALGIFSAGVGLALVGLLLPVWADDTVSIIWWGLAAVAIAGGKNGRKTK